MGALGRTEDSVPLGDLRECRYPMAEAQCCGVMSVDTLKRLDLTRRTRALHATVTGHGCQRVRKIDLART